MKVLPYTDHDAAVDELLATHSYDDHATVDYEDPEGDEDAEDLAVRLVPRLTAEDTPITDPERLVIPVVAREWQTIDDGIVIPDEGDRVRLVPSGKVGVVTEMDNTSVHGVDDEGEPFAVSSDQVVSEARVYVRSLTPGHEGEFAVDASVGTGRKARKGKEFVPLQHGEPVVHTPTGQHGTVHRNVDTKGFIFVQFGRRKQRVKAADLERAAPPPKGLTTAPATMDSERRRVTGEPASNPTRKEYAAVTLGGAKLDVAKAPIRELRGAMVRYRVGTGDRWAYGMVIHRSGKHVRVVPLDERGVAKDKRVTGARQLAWVPMSNVEETKKLSAGAKQDKLWKKAENAAPKGSREEVKAARAGRPSTIKPPVIVKPRAKTSKLPERKRPDAERLRGLQVLSRVTWDSDTGTVRQGVVISHPDKDTLHIYDARAHQHVLISHTRVVSAWNAQNASSSMGKSSRDQLDDLRAAWQDASAQARGGQFLSGDTLHTGGSTEQNRAMLDAALSAFRDARVRAGEEDGEERGYDATPRPGEGGPATDQGKIVSRHYEHAKPRLLLPGDEVFAIVNGKSVHAVVAHNAGGVRKKLTVWTRTHIAPGRRQADSSRKVEIAYGDVHHTKQLPRSKRRANFASTTSTRGIPKDERAALVKKAEDVGGAGQILVAADTGGPAAFRNPDFDRAKHGFEGIAHPGAPGDALSVGDRAGLDSDDGNVRQLTFAKLPEEEKAYRMGGREGVILVTDKKGELEDEEADLPKPKRSRKPKADVTVVPPPDAPAITPKKGSGRAAARALKEAVFQEADSFPEGVMIALYPSPRLAAKLALDGGEDTDALHLTLAFLGKQGDLPDAEGLHDVVKAWAARTAPMSGEISGVGLFTAGPAPVTYLSVDLPPLPEGRQALVDALDAAGQPLSRDHGYTPHMTLAYADRVADVTAGGERLRFDRVALVIGPDRTDYELAAPIREARHDVHLEPRDPGGKWTKGGTGRKVKRDVEAAYGGGGQYSHNSSAFRRAYGLPPTAEHQDSMRPHADRARKALDGSVADRVGLIDQITDNERWPFDPYGDEILKTSITRLRQIGATDLGGLAAIAVSEGRHDVALHLDKARLGDGVLEARLGAAGQILGNNLLIDDATDPVNLERIDDLNMMSDGELHTLKDAGVKIHLETCDLRELRLRYPQLGRYKLSGGVLGFYAPYSKEVFIFHPHNHGTDRDTPQAEDPGSHASITLHEVGHALDYEHAFGQDPAIGLSGLPESSAAHTRIRRYKREAPNPMYALFGADAERMGVKPTREQPVLRDYFQQGGEHGAKEITAEGYAWIRRWGWEATAEHFQDDDFANWLEESLKNTYPDAEILEADHA